jgi:hypothetical protein
VEAIRKIIKEAFLVKEGFNVDWGNVRSPLGNTFAQNIVDKPSSLCNLEFKFTKHDPKEIDSVIREITPLLNDIHVKYISKIALNNLMVITCNKDNVDECKRLCQKFGFSLVRELVSDDKNRNTNPFNQENNAPDANGSNRHTSYGRDSTSGRSNGGAGGLFGGAGGFPIDRLAGE